MLTVDIIFLVILVAFIFIRLWRALGTNTTIEAKKVKLSREGAEKLYDLLKSEAEKNLKDASQNAPVLVPIDSEPLSEVDQTLSQIPEFNKTTFISGAKKAFQVITDAFNNSDSETLKMLVSPAIFKKMQAVIKQRLEDEISAETDFICFNKADIIKAKIDNKSKAVISVEFVSEQVNVLRNKDNQIIEGDENYIQTITDVWTFERALDAKTPNWVLVSTKK